MANDDEKKYGDDACDEDEEPTGWEVGHDDGGGGGEGKGLDGRKS